MERRFASIHLSEMVSHCGWSKPIDHNVASHRKTDISTLPRLEDTDTVNHQKILNDIEGQTPAQRQRQIPKRVIEKNLEIILRATGEVPIDTIVIGCFGAFISLTSSDDDGYGQLTMVSSHADWRGANIYQIALNYLKKKYKDKRQIPNVIVSTDVDLTALGEFWADLKKQKEQARWSARKTAQKIDESIVVFLKISRSINGGIAYAGEHWKGRHHPLMSVLKPRIYHWIDYERKEVRYDPFKGSCSVHGDCIEGLIGVDALAERSGKSFDEFLKGEHYDIWDIVAYYVSRLCVISTSVLSPQKIILGGRIIEMCPHSDLLLNRIRVYFHDQIKSRTEDDVRISPDYPELRDLNTFIGGRNDLNSGINGGLIMGWHSKAGRPKRPGRVSPIK